MWNDLLKTLRNGAAAIALGLFTVGCEPRQRDIDVEPPADSLEQEEAVSKTDRTDIDRDKPTNVDVETPLGDVHVDQKDGKVDVDVDAGKKKD